MIRYDFPQGSDEWRKARIGLVTASEMDKVIRGEPVATGTMSPNEKSLVVKFRDHAKDKLAASPSVPVATLQQNSLRSVVTAAHRVGIVLKDA